jgi:hypothetical protein
MPRRVRLGGDLFHPRVPPGAVKVTRPTRWGNPHPIGKPCRRCDGAVHDRDQAIARYREHLTEHPELIATARETLAGRDLACWCPLDERCHADVLIEIANS